VLQKAHRILDEIRLFGLSSKMALKAISMNKQSLLRDSGFERFRNALYQTLIAEQGLQVVRKSIQSIYDMAKEIQNQYQKNHFQYNEALKKTEQLIRRMDQYKSNYLNPLDAGFAKADPTICHLINSFADMKQKLVQFFIAELSALTSASNEDIMNAIAKGIKQCIEYANGDGSSDIKGCIEKELFAVIQAYKDVFSSFWIDEDEKQDESNQPSWNLPLYSLTLEQVLHPVKIPEFILIINPTAADGSLAGHNIIGDIREDINQAVTAYINRWNYYIRQYRLWCFSQAENEMKLLYEYMMQKSADDTRYFHMQIHINEANYEMSQTVLKEILEDVEALQSRFNLQIF
jgi:hypothetical protein